MEPSPPPVLDVDGIVEGGAPAEPPVEPTWEENLRGFLDFRVSEIEEEKAVVEKELEEVETGAPQGSVADGSEGEPREVEIEAAKELLRQKIEEAEKEIQTLRDIDVEKNRGFHEHFKKMILDIVGVENERIEKEVGFVWTSRDGCSSLAARSVQPTRNFLWMWQNYWVWSRTCRGSDGPPFEGSVES